ncbi:MAG TPA: dihydrolipoamide acetyltransferase family protein [Polyangiaceae bacterium]|jgi:2-oxoglutarate dehydrogenase E2 component (dihydrolipoamide succinyltransferase)|nr:dihydrolipoamide acetyltransferase family protein [Polyangiaceae bacterium]
MIIDVVLPQLGESVAEGTISKWLVREGDAVEKDQPIASIATDKADSELPAPVKGRVAKLLAAEGSVVPVKAVIAQIEQGAAGNVAAPAPSAAQAPSPAPAPPNPAPQPPQPSASLSAAPGAPVSLPPPPSAPSPRVPEIAPPQGRAPMATPTVRRAALENDVDLDRVQGTGERGRVTKDDVLRAANVSAAPPVKERQSTPPPAIEPPQARAVEAPPPQRTSPQAQQVAAMINGGGGFVPPIPGVGFGAFKVPAYRQAPGDKIIPFTRRRRITADHMTYSKFASPHVVTVAEVDVHRASKLREAHKDRYKAEGMSLTMLAFAVVATAKALRENPQVNSRVLDDAYAVLNDINVGVAVDSPDGLVVPVVRRADELGIRGIVRAIDDVARRARAGKITIDDLSGATFTVSNPGLKGNLFGGAIISQPNVGILRMGEIQKRVVVIEANGEDVMAIHPVMFMALSYDHRVVDGVAANSFLWRVTELLEKAEFEV